MASGGGPRAAGSGLKEEGKFRQRVDDHYKVMAAAKKTIGTAGRLQLASALGMGTTMGVAATQPEVGSMVLGGVSFVIMLFSAMAARTATAAAGAKDAEKHAVSYSGSLKVLAALMVLAGLAGAGISAAELLDVPPLPLVVAFGCVLGVGLMGCLLGLRGAGQLLDAFASQKAKAKMK